MRASDVLPSSSSTRQMSTMLRPPPPTSAGMFMANRPSDCAFDANRAQLVFGNLSELLDFLLERLHVVVDELPHGVDQHPPVVGHGDIKHHATSFCAVADDAARRTRRRRSCRAVSKLGEKLEAVRARFERHAAKGGHVPVVAQWMVDQCRRLAANIHLAEGLVVDRLRIGAQILVVLDALIPNAVLFEGSGDTRQSVCPRAYRRPSAHNGRVRHSGRYSRNPRRVSQSSASASVSGSFMDRTIRQSASG